MRALILMIVLSGCGSSYGTSVLSGCVAGTRSTEIQTPGPPVFQVDRDVVTVDWVFAHACCRTASSSIALEPGVLRFAVTLGGNACRCPCQSRLRASSDPLPSGTYRVVAMLDGEEAGSQTITVP